MSFAGEWKRRLQMLLHRDEFQRELEEELRLHLELRREQQAARGATPEAARRAAHHRFGNFTLIQERSHMAWGWNWLERAVRNVKYGARTLRLSPSFSIVSVLVMALGIGATTSLFTIVRAVLLRPLPFRDPGKLVMLYEHFRQNTGGDGFNAVAPGDFRDWRSQTHSFEDMAAMRGYGGILSGVQSELPEVVQSAGASANFFSLLGVSPVFGRTFTAAEDRPEAQPVVILTWNLFQRRFAGNPSIVGKQVHLDTIPTTVIGVLPSWFTYPDAKIQFWLPYGQTFSPADYDEHDGHQSMVVARLKPGMNAEAATHEVSALQYQIHLANASKPVAEDVWSRPMIDDLAQDVRMPLLVLLGAVGCMLLIACLNLTNLLVARSATRHREVAVRGALGGSRVVLICEQMTESLLICMAGGVLGLLLSLASTYWLAAHWHNLPRAESVHVDGWVLTFTLALVVAAALLAGLVPAISSTGTGLLSGLRDTSRTVGGGNARARLRKAMLTTEIALTVVLLISAGLLFKSFLHLRTTDLGCRIDHVMTMKFGLPEIQYDTRDKVVRFHEGLLARLRHLPGIRGAGLVSVPPGSGPSGDRVFTIPERPAPSYSLQYDAVVLTADPQYFSVMQIPLLRGRVFTEHERLNNDHYIVVSKTFVDQYLSGDDPVGKHVRVDWDTKPETYEILGEVGNTVNDITKPVPPTMYFPILSGLPDRTSEATIVASTAGDPLTMSMPIQRQISALDPELPVYSVLTMDQILGRTSASEGFAADLVIAFAALSLLLSAVGLYGVLSYLTTQRTPDIGLRIAVGAQRSQLLRLVLFEGLRPALVGLIFGVAASALVTQLLRSMLYGTRPLDPGTFAVAAMMLMAVAVLACLIPAWRASRIDPIRALRTE
jgi:predicted permease